MIRDVMVLAGCLFVSSCGDDDCCTAKPADAAAPDTASVDAPSRLVDAAAPKDAAILCTAEPSYPPPAVPGRATDYAANLYGSGSPHEMTYVAPLDNASPRDILFVDLYAGYGVFATSDITTGTFTIAGDDAKFSTCGACVLIAADVTSTTITDWYMATSGTITLTSVDISQLGSDGFAHFTGSLSNITLVHVANSPGGYPSDTVADGCTSMIGSATLDGPMAAGSAGLTSGGESARLIQSVDVEVRVLHDRRSR